MENRDPNRVGRVLWSSQGVAQHQGGGFVDLQVGWALLQDHRQLLELLDFSGNMGQTSSPAERALSEPGGHQGLGVSVSLGRYEAESDALAGTEGKTEAGTGDTAGIGSMAGTGSRVESGRRAETEDAVAVAAAAAGWADSVPKVWAVPLLLAVLAEVQAAEAGRWVWLGEMASESAVGS